MHIENTECTICIKRSSHGCSSAVKWGLKSASSEGIVDNAHIATASLINGASVLHDHVDEFLVRYLRFEEVHGGGLADREAFWRALGVEPDWVDKFADVDKV